MLKILLVINMLVTIAALVFWVIGIKHIKNEEYSIKGIRYIIRSVCVIGICIILNAILFLSIFFPR